MGGRSDGLSKLPSSAFLVEIQRVSNLYPTMRAWKCVLLFIFVADLRARDYYRVARNTFERITDNHDVSSRSVLK